MSDKNVGFIDEPLAPEDYVLGSQSKLPVLILQENQDWTAHLPEKELQAARGFEPSACVAYTLLNCAEILVKKIYKEARNWADRALAKLTDTDKKGGNSFKAGADFLRNRGALPEELWPNDANSFEEYYKELPQETLDVLHEFTDEFDFGYERVEIKDIPQALKLSPLAIAVAAWWQDENGNFYKPQGVTEGHATTLFKYEDGVYYCFDTYDSPHIKKYISEPSVAYRFHIEKKTNVQAQLSLIQSIINALKNVLESMKKRVDELVEKDTKSPSERLLELAEAHVNVDVTPNDEVDDVVACADSLTTLLRKQYPDLPHSVYTPTTFKDLENSSHFERTKIIAPGHVIISPTGFGNGKVRGHCGILGKNEVIWSNQSATGLWTNHLTLGKWVDRYRDEGDLPIYVYKPL